MKRNNDLEKEKKNLMLMMNVDESRSKVIKVHRKIFTDNNHAFFFGCESWRERTR